MIDSDWSEETPVRLFSSVQSRKNAGAAERTTCWIAPWQRLCMPTAKARRLLVITDSRLMTIDSRLVNW
jgi:hypothetical protein